MFTGMSSIGFMIAHQKAAIVSFIFIEWKIKVQKDTVTLPRPHSTSKKEWKIQYITSTSERPEPN
jgi:hypothetical protein